MHTFFREHWIIVGIILIAFMLRFYHFAAIPEGFHADEASFGYNAYSILKTGKDEYGKFLPLSLKSFGDYKGAIYAYITVPFIATMGLTEAAVRLPSVLFGTALVFLVYLLTKKLTKDRKLSYITAGLSAISPLGILFSRIQSDPLVSVFFVLFGFYLFLLWLEKRQLLLLFAAGFFWIVSFFTYASPRIFVPALLVLLLFFYGSQAIKHAKKSFFATFFIVFVLACYLLFGNSGQRFQQLSVFNTPAVMLPLQEQIREDGSSSALLARAFHNKLIGYGRFFVKQYSDYFTFNFLFLNGGQPAREIIPDVGVLYLIEFPFLLFGIYEVFRQRKPWGIFLALWFFIVPGLMALAVDESPNVHRFFLAILPIHVLTAYGLLEFFGLIKRQRKIFLFFLFVIPCVFLYSLVFFLHQLFVHQPVHMPWYRGYAYKGLVSAIDKQYPKYKKIIITKSQSSPYIYILFYDKYNPVKYQREGSPRDLDYSGFDKYYFVPEDCPLNGAAKGDNNVQGEVGVLYIDKGTCVPPKQNVKVIQTIYWRDNSPAFILLEYTGTDSGSIKTL